ncbi:MAG: EAL domain-containing protein [Actinomycetales bacterium]|nr:EAL domain-containing protein [Actinomycetales bacterium]
MITMGSLFDVPVIAEGVETEQGAAAPGDLGCRLVQGFLFSLPVPAPEIVRRLRSAAAPVPG